MSAATPVLLNPEQIEQITRVKDLFRQVFEIAERDGAPDEKQTLLNQFATHIQNINLHAENPEISASHFDDLLFHTSEVLSRHRDDFSGVFSGVFKPKSFRETKELRAEIQAISNPMLSTLPARPARKSLETLRVEIRPINIEIQIPQNLINLATPMPQIPNFHVPGPAINWSEITNMTNQQPIAIPANLFAPLTETPSDQILREAREEQARAAARAMLFQRHTDAAKHPHRPESDTNTVSGPGAGG
jgi:hypothetical protein